MKTPSYPDPSPQKLYYHGEPLNVNVHVTNNSTKTVKKIKVSGRRWGLEGGLTVGGVGGAVSANVASSISSAPGLSPVWETHGAQRLQAVCPGMSWRGSAGPQRGRGPCLGLELSRGLSVPHAQRLGTWPLPPTVRQYADICLFSTAQYKCPVAQVEQE